LLPRSETEHACLSRRRMQDARQDLDCCGFTSAVRADERDRFSLADSQINAVDRDHLRYRSPESMPSRKHKTLLQVVDLHSVLHSALQVKKISERLSPNQLIFLGFD